MIEQKQTGGLPTLVKDGSTTHLFHLPAVIERFDFLRRREEDDPPSSSSERYVSVYSFLAESKPLMARVSTRGGAIPKTLKFPRPKEMLIHQLKHDDDSLGRIEAAKELSLIADREGVAALVEAAANDPFWGVQAEAAGRLAEIRMDSARDGLISALAALGRKGGGHPKARRAIVAALGTFKDEPAATALKPFAEKDASYAVEADAAYAWAQAKLRPVPVPKAQDVNEVEAFLLGQLEKPSYREVIRSTALGALSELPGIGRGERPKAISALIEWSRPVNAIDVRVSATLGLARVALAAVPSERSRIFDVLGQLADEDNFRLRVALVAGLRTAGGAEASFLLWKIKGHDIDPRVRRGALAAIEALDADAGQSEAVATLRTSLEKLEEEHRKLRSAFEEAKAGLSGAGAAAK